MSLVATEEREICVPTAPRTDKDVGGARAAVNEGEMFAERLGTTSSLNAVEEAS